MNRRPPREVRRILRKEVVFGCPVPGCGSPYLEWHHFDPPWHVTNHHNAEGMIALCREHHIQADNGAFTKEQLQSFKKNGRKNWAQTKGKFNWMRNDLLVVVGGNFYIKTPIIFEYKDQPIIWFERGRDNYLLLNTVLLTTTGQNRVCIRNNEWENTGGEEDIECPPSGKKLKISYPNGDSVSVEFFELLSPEAFTSKYEVSPDPEISYPTTVVEMTYIVANSPISFSSSETKIGGITIKKCFMRAGRAAIALH